MAMTINSAGQVAEIHNNTVPTEHSAITWQALGKTDALGKIKIWHISYADGVITSYHGRVDGKRVTVAKAVVVNKSGRSLFEQARVETRSAWRKKLQEGYRPLLEFGIDEDCGSGPQVIAEDAMKILLEMSGLQLLNVDATQVSFNHPMLQIKPTPQSLLQPNVVVQLPAKRDIFEPMLAQAYDTTKKLKWPLWAQEKLDGARMTAVITIDPSTNQYTLQCRSRKTGTYSHLNHIKTQAMALLKFLPPDTILDGELYSLDLDFRELIKRVRQHSNPHPDEMAVKYFIFDAFLPHQPELPTEDRHRLLSEAMTKYHYGFGRDGSHLNLVGLELVHNHEEVMAAHDRFVAKGSEGLILRHFGKVDPKRAAYRCGRSVNLLKYKNFVDEEGLIIGAEQGSGTEVGLVLWRVRDPRGYEMIVRPRGTFQERAELYQNWSEYVGKLLTYRYQPSNDYDKPRFPVGIAIRDYEPDGTSNTKLVREDD